MKNWYILLSIVLLAMFMVPHADASVTYTTDWDGNEYDTIGGSYTNPDCIEGKPWICLSHNTRDSGVAAYKFDHTALSFPGLYKYTVSVEGYDNSGARIRTQFGLFDFKAEDIVYLSKGLPVIQGLVSGSVTSSLERFSNSSDEIWIVIVAKSNQHGHIKRVKLAIEYKCYPPAVPEVPWTVPGSICSPQDFYHKWNSVPEATTYRLYEDGAILYEGPDTSTYPPDLYSRPAGTYAFTVSAGNEYGWSAQGPVYLSVIRPSPGAVEHIYIPSNDQCESAPFEVSWSSVTDAWYYSLYIGDQNPPSTWYAHIYAPDTSIDVSLPPGKYNFVVRAKNDEGCSGDRSPVDSLTVDSLPSGGIPVPVWASSGMSNLCQGGVYYLYWTTIPAATGYRVYENGVLCGTFDSETKRIMRYHDEGGEWDYYLQAAIGNCWSDNSDTITVTMRYEAPPPAPAQPSTSPVTVCPNSSYTVSWLPVTGAVSYKLYENSTNIYQGSGLSTTCINNHGAYEYYVQAYDGECYSHLGDKMNLVIPVPVDIPDAIAVPDYDVPIDEEYTVSWSTVAGAGYYELYEDGGLIYNGADTQMVLSHDTPGDYIYEVAACNDCDCSDLILSDIVQVRVITDVREIPSDELPGEFTLSQNYPNPFNPTTSIDFSLPRAAHVRIEVFNILGGKICTLVDEYISAGYKSVVWDGRSSSGQASSSGVYLFRITAGEFSACRKALLMK